MAGGKNKQRCQQKDKSNSSLIVSYKPRTVAVAQSHALSVKSCGLRSNSRMSATAVFQSDLDFVTAFSATQMASST